MVVAWRPSISMKTLIVIPAHNEEESLPTLLRELADLGYDTLVVNDASTDRTAAIAASFGSPKVDPEFETLI